MEINEDKLDESWIKDFDKIDNLYSDYYKNDNYQNNNENINV